jgi:hypothetical protein
LGCAASSLAYEIGASQTLSSGSDSYPEVAGNIMGAM